MSVGEEPGYEHPDWRTQRSGFRYFFYDKHHGRGGENVSQWRPEITDEEEFQIFDDADRLELADETGNLYGVLSDDNGQIRVIGTLQQQVAKFPVQRATDPWHGYPFYPVSADRHVRQPPPNRHMPREVLRRMLDVEALTRRQYKRLRKGQNA
jgi:hypothetical protein